MRGIHIPPRFLPQWAKTEPGSKELDLHALVEQAAVCLAFLRRAHFPMEFAELPVLAHSLEHALVPALQAMS